MTNSLILNGIANFSKWISEVFKNSKCYELLIRLDNFLSHTAKHSTFTKFFTLHNENKIIKNSLIISMFGKFFGKVIEFIGLLKKSILNSYIVSIINRTIHTSIEKPHKLVGTFILFFAVSNLIYRLISGQASSNDIIIRIVMILLAFTMMLITIDFKKTLEESKFIRICKWFLSYED